MIDITTCKIKPALLNLATWNCNFHWFGLLHATYFTNDLLYFVTNFLIFNFLNFCKQEEELICSLGKTGHFKLKFVGKTLRKKSGGGWLCSPKMSVTLHASNLFSLRVHSPDKQKALRGFRLEFDFIDSSPFLWVLLQCTITTGLGLSVHFPKVLSVQ